MRAMGGVLVICLYCILFPVWPLMALISLRDPDSHTGRMWFSRLLLLGCFTAIAGVVAFYIGWVILGLVLLGVYGVQYRAFFIVHEKDVNEWQ